MDSTASRVSSTVSETALELPALLSLVAELTVTDVGRIRVGNLRPYRSRIELESHRQRLSEIGVLLQDGRLAQSSEEPVLPLLESLRQGDALSHLFLGPTVLASHNIYYVNLCVHQNG